jgi:hypothetical protein
MIKSRLVLVRVVVIVAMLVVVGPLQPQQPTSERTPTTDHPIRFSAFSVNQRTGKSGTLDIAIERWSADAERKSLDLVSTATDRERGQDRC